jgi:hypothetical protein
LLEIYPDSEPALLRTLSHYASIGSGLFLGNSMPIREWNLFAQWLRPVPSVRANRGVNGIDGQVSTWLGWSAEVSDAWAIIGDLTALYDLAGPFVLDQINGQGRVLAGAVAGSAEFINGKLLPFQRNTGPNIAPFNAWVVLKGLETLDLRIRRQSENALKVARFIEGRLPTVRYPFLPSHPQYALAQKQMLAGGSIMSLEVPGGRPQAHALLDALQLVDISNNIGDSRSLMCHPASTTHHGVGPETRADMGVTEGMLRLNVGLEDPADVIEDLDQALRAAGL